MNKVKVNDFIDVLARCKGFNTEITDIVKEYMQKVISKYEKVFPNGIDASLDNNKYFIKPVNGRYSIEDFLLNRMFRSKKNIRGNINYILFIAFSIAIGELGDKTFLASIGLRNTISLL